MPSPTTPLLRSSSPPATDNGNASSRSSGSDFRQAMGNARKDSDASAADASDHAGASDASSAKAGGANNGDRNAAQDQHAEASATHRGQDEDSAQGDRKDTPKTKENTADKSSHDTSAAGTPAVPVLNLIEVAQRQPVAVNGKTLPLASTSHAGSATLTAGSLATGSEPTGLPAATLTEADSTDTAAKTGPGDARPGLASLAGLEPEHASGDTPHARDHTFAQLLAAPPAAMQAPSATAATAAAHPLTVNVPPQSPQFAPAVGQHVAWLAGQDIKDARIQLHPRDLGPINVHVHVHHDRVDVNFAVQHPDTVHALQQTLPQLDSLLARHGLNLGQASVDQQHSGGQQGTSRQDGSTRGEAGSIDTDAAALPPATRAAIGLVDAFA